MFKFIFVVVVFSVSVSHASWEPFSWGNTSPPELEPCQCIGAIKDYDAQKGYYFDRVTGTAFSKTISARFACSYFCRGSGDDYFKVTYVHEESHKGGKSSGADHAKWFICDNSIGRFIPRHDPVGRLLYYDTIAYGPFEARQGPRPEFKQWASATCRADFFIEQDTF